MINFVLKYQADFNHATKYLESLDNLTEDEKIVLFYHIQNYLFDSVSHIEDRELAKMQNISMPTLKKIIQPLVKQGFMVQNKNVHLFMYYLKNL